MATIGENVRYYRKRRGLTQGELAEDAGTTQYTVSSIELGNRDPHPATLRKLSESLGIDVADLFREPVEVPKAPPVSALPDDLHGALDKVTELRHKWEHRAESDTTALANEINLLAPFLSVTLNREMAWLRSQFPGEQDVTPRQVVGLEIAAYLGLYTGSLTESAPLATALITQLRNRRAS